jgi:lambda family phage portal protein
MASLTLLDLSEARQSLNDAAAAARMTISGPATGKRAYDAAVFSRLTEDWSTVTTSADLDLWSDIYRLRARARRESQNNPLGRKALKIFRKNVFGPDGIRLRAKVPMKKGKKLNVKLNSQIEQLFLQWGRRDYCTVQGNMSWKNAQGFSGTQVFRDGECFIRRRFADNKFNFSLQFIDPDQLDTNYYLYQMRNGNVIRMGIEMNPDGRPIAYHFWDRHPAEVSISPKNRIRIPAEEIIHLYSPERVMQSRGVPEIASSLLHMHMHNQYSMAEVVAARIAAAKMGFFEKTASDAGFEGNERDENRNVKVKMSPGTTETLPEGLTFKPWDPQHPTTAFPAFTKMLMRLIGSGMDMSYETLANDREGVNYSSIRAGLLDDRDTWREWQQYFSEALCDRVIAWFLESIWLSGLLQFDGAPDDLFGYMEWTGRAWAWIDPLKDMQALTLAQENGLQTHTEQLAASGNDFEETMDQFAYEKKYKEQLGLQFGTDVHGKADTATDDSAETDSAGASGSKTKQGEDE